MDFQGFSYAQRIGGEHRLVQYGIDHNIHNYFLLLRFGANLKEGYAASRHKTGIIHHRSRHGLLLLLSDSVQLIHNGIRPLHKSSKPSAY
ncbi:hypothetical protein D3C71_1786010 [compost metagenome]